MGTPTPSPTTTKDITNCCFIIQETVSAEWWPVTNVTYKTKEVNLTSITTLITPYPNATSTNVITNVYLTNASFPITQTLGNPIGNYPNNAFDMSELDTQLNGTATITAGVTMYEPSPLGKSVADSKQTIPTSFLCLHNSKNHHRPPGSSNRRPNNVRHRLLLAATELLQRPSHIL